MIQIIMINKKQIFSGINDKYLVFFMFALLRL